MADFSCPICMEAYDNFTREPRSLTCGHTLCAKCVTQIITSDQNDRNFVSGNCPTCRAHGRYERRVPTNYAIRDAVENSENRKKKSTSSSRPKEKNHCSQCLKTKPLDDLVSCEQCQNAILCVVCLLIKHQGHKVISYNEHKIAKRRLETRQKITSLEQSMREAKHKLQLDISRLVKMCNDNEKSWESLQFPNAIYVHASKVESMEDSEKLRKECADLTASFLVRLNECSAAVKNAEIKIIASMDFKGRNPRRRGLARTDEGNEYDRLFGAMPSWSSEGNHNRPIWSRFESYDDTWNQRQAPIPPEPARFGQYRCGNLFENDIQQIFHDL